MRHWPWSEQEDDAPHEPVHRWHASPVKPTKHSQTPVSARHSPAPEHICVCMPWPPSVAFDGSEPQSGPTGHSRSVQSMEPICLRLSPDPNPV